MNVQAIAAALAEGITNDQRGIVSAPDAKNVAEAFTAAVTSKTNITDARKVFATAEKFLDMAELAARTSTAKSTLTSARRAAKTHLQDLLDLKSGFATEAEIRNAARDYVMGPYARAEGWTGDIDGETYFDVNDSWHFNALYRITDTLDSEGIPYSSRDNIMMVNTCVWSVDEDRELVEMNVAVDRTDAKVLGYYKSREFTPA